MACPGDQCGIKIYMTKFEFSSETDAGLGKSHPRVHANARKEAKKFGEYHNHSLAVGGPALTVDLEVSLSSRKPE